MGETRILKPPITMALEDFIPKPVDPGTPKVLDLALCRRLINAAPRNSFLPGGGMLVEFAEQLQLALNEITGSTSKVVGAQNEAMRFQREAEAANTELRSANLALIAARQELAQTKAQLFSYNTTSGAMNPPASENAAPKTRKARAEVVPMSPATESKAAAQ